MPYYEKSEDWLHQSALLLQAYPTTTRITTRYHLKPARRPTKAEKAAAKATPTTTETTKPPRGHLVLKTFDPASGVTLKYKTSKAAEVGRLVQMLGTLGRRMAALPEREEEEVVGAAEEMVGVDGTGAGAGAATPVPVAGGDKGGAGKKKKKGKK